MPKHKEKKETKKDKIILDPDMEASGSQSIFYIQSHHH